MTSSIFSQDGDFGSSHTPPGSGGGSKAEGPTWFAGLLTHEDLAVVDPTRGRFLLQLRALATRRRQILMDPTLSHEDRCRQADNLALTQPGTTNIVQASGGQGDENNDDGQQQQQQQQQTTTNSSSKPSVVSQKIESAAGQVRLEDLCLTFQFAPSSRVFGFADVELRAGGADFEVRYSIELRKLAQIL